jgi:TolA-binding protein
MARLFSVALAFIVISVSCQAQLLSPLIEHGSDGIASSDLSYHKGLLYSSERLLRQAIERFPESASADKAVLLRSMIESASGNQLGADAVLSDFLSHRVNSPLIAHALLERGNIAAKEERYERAIGYYHQAQSVADQEYSIREDSSYLVMAATAIYWNGTCNMLLGKHDDARVQFELCVSKYPTNIYADDAIYGLGYIAESNRHTGEAIKYFSSIRQKYNRRNSHISSLIRAASNELRERDFSSGLMLIESAENALYHVQSSDSIGKLFEPQTAIEHANEEILYLRGQAYNLATQYDSAVSVLTEFSQKFPVSPLFRQAIVAKGWSLLNLGKYTEAAKVYQTILDSTTDEQADATLSLAQLYHAVSLKLSGNREQALREFSSLSVLPNYPYLAQVLLESGQMYYENLQYDNARKSLERAERESPDAPTSARIQLFLGAVYLEQQSYGKAARAYSTAEKLARASNRVAMPLRDKYLAESRLKQGIAYSQNMQQREAITALTTFLGEHGADPRKEEAMFWLAESYYRSELLKNAEEFYRQILDNYPAGKRVEEALYGLGWTFFRKQDFANSAAFFARLVKDFPQTRFAAEALIRKGDGHYILKEYGKAADSYRQAVARSPKSDEGQYASYQIGQAYYRQRDYDKSVEAFRTYVKSYPKSSLAPRALYSIGWAHFQQKKYEESISDYRKLIETYPSSDLLAQAHYSIGDSYYNLGDFEKAIEAYKIVLTSYPSSPYAGEAVKSMQFCLETLGRTDEATQIADTFIAGNPQLEVSKELSFSKAFKFSTNKNYPNAISEFENYLKKYPDNDRNAEALYYLEKSYAGINEPVKAEQTMNEILKKFPKSEFAPLSILDFAKMNLDQQNALRADSLFQIVQTQYPANIAAAEAGFERAQINYTRGDTVTALRLYRDVTLNFKNNEYADQSRYRIAMYLRNKGLSDSARTEFTVLAAREDNPLLAAEGAYRIGELWLREKNYPNALLAFKVVSEKFSGVEDWYTLSMIGLGECYEQTYDVEAARDIYKTIAKLRPTDDYGKTAQSRLKRLPKTP